MKSARQPNSQDQNRTEDSSNHDTSHLPSITVSSVSEEERAKILAASKLYFEIIRLEKNQILRDMVNLRCQTIANRNWDVTPFDNSAESINIAEFCQRVVNNLPSKKKIVAGLAMAFWTGLSVSEIIWKIDDDGTVTVADIKHRDSAIFRHRSDGTLFYRYSSESREDHKLPPLKFISCWRSGALSDLCFSKYQAEVEGRSTSDLDGYSMADSIALGILGQTSEQYKSEPKVRSDIVDGDAEALALTLQQVINWVVDLNYPAAPGYPKLRLKIGQGSFKDVTSAELLSPMNWFRRNGNYWSVGFGGVQLEPLPNQLGFSYIGKLLLRPSYEYQSSELYRECTLPEVSCASIVEFDPGSTKISSSISGSAIEYVDKKAIKGIKNRLQDIEEELQLSDLSPEERENLLAEKGRVEKYASQSAGLFHKSRLVASEREKATKAIRQAITRAINYLGTSKEIKSQELAAHLAASIKYRGAITYRPTESLTWDA